MCRRLPPRTRNDDVAGDAREEVKAIISATGEYLSWLKAEGVASIEVGQFAKVADVPARGRGKVAAPSSLPAAAPRATPDPDLDAIAAEIKACTRCALHATRTNTVPGQGNPQPEILFIGEAPGADEDEQGLAFVGRAGQLLTKMIEAMGFRRDEVFIANILKCRPPDNRQPTPEEMAVCIPFLKRQIALLKPRVIVALGATAVKGLLETQTGITKLRGIWQDLDGIPVMPTYHPAYLLRNPPSKKDVWADLQTVLKRLGRTPPPVKKG